jgi:hypothetical protein
MSQMLQARSGVPHDPDLLRLDVGPLSHRFPSGAARVGIMSAALHRSAALARPVGKNVPDVRHAGPDVERLSYNPFMRKKAAHPKTSQPIAISL